MLSIDSGNLEQKRSPPLVGTPLTVWLTRTAVYHTAVDLLLVPLSRGLLGTFLTAAFRCLFHFFCRRKLFYDAIMRDVEWEMNIADSLAHLSFVAPVRLGLSGGRCGSANSAQ